MIEFQLTPQAREDTVMQISVTGDTLIINGCYLDFAPLQEGATLPMGAINCPLVAGDVKRENGRLIVPILLLIGPDASEAACFPEPIIVTQDGPVELPQ